MGRQSLRQHRWRNRLEAFVLVAGIATVLGLSLWLMFGNETWALVLMLVFVPLLWCFASRIPVDWLLRGAGARVLRQHQTPDLHRMVALLSFKAGLEQPPRLFWLPGAEPNAYTVGQGSQASIAISDALFQRLSYAELAGVLAHEISHIRNHDIQLMTMADTVTRLTQLMSVLAQLSVLLCIPLWLMGEVSISFLGVGLLIIAPVLSELLQWALSRSREFRADLDACELTGDPCALASALGKLEWRQRFYGLHWMLRRKGEGAPELLRSHPPTEERIRRLLAQGTGREAGVRSDAVHGLALKRRPGLGHRRFWR